MSDFAPGDLVVCVDAGPCRCGCGLVNPSLQLGRHYRIKSVVVWPASRSGTPILCLGLASFMSLPNHMPLIAARRFRKLNDGEEDAELIARIKQCKPVKIPELQPVEATVLRPSRQDVWPPEAWDEMQRIWRGEDPVSLIGKEDEDDE